MNSSVTISTTQNSFISPTYVIPFRRPLSTKVSSRSHCAMGNTNDIAPVAIIQAQVDGTPTKSNKNRLNFPYPVAEIASSNVAGPLGIVFA